MLAIRQVAPANRSVQSLVLPHMLEHRPFTHQSLAHSLSVLQVVPSAAVPEPILGKHTGVQPVWVLSSIGQG